MVDRLALVQHLQHLAQAEPRPANPNLETLMKDDPNKTGLDRKLIALDEPHEVRSWSESLGVSEQQLKAAVAAVGNSADKVREYVRKK
jgi:hypothetical protein